MNTVYGSMGASSPWMDATNRQRNPNAQASFGPQSWNTTGYRGRLPKYEMLERLFGKAFGGGAGGAGGTGAGAGGAGAGGGLGNFDIQTPFQPAPVYDPTSLQVARNQMRAQVPSALSSGIRSTPAGVSGTLGHQTDIQGAAQDARQAGEGGVQQAMLQARLENARNLLAGQMGVMQSGQGLAGGLLNRAGTEQQLRYGLANQGLDRTNIGMDTLMALLQYS